MAEVKKKRLNAEIVAAALIRRRDGKFLFTLRGGLWTLPTGNMEEPTDKKDIFETLFRETKEELEINRGELYIVDFLGITIRPSLTQPSVNKGIEIFYCKIIPEAVQRIVGESFMWQRLTDFFARDGLAKEAIGRYLAKFVYHNIGMLSSMRRDSNVERRKRFYTTEVATDCSV